MAYDWEGVGRAWREVFVFVTEEVFGDKESEDEEEEEEDVRNLH